MHTEDQVIEIPFLQIFNEQNWANLLPKKYLVKSKMFQLDQSDTQFFIDDCTNPDYSRLKINQSVNTTISDNFNGAAFLKVYGRTAKDINHTMSKILNSQDLTMAIKMSEFLTEALDQELQYQTSQMGQNSQKEVTLKICLRQYITYLESPSNQFRLYFLNDSLVAVSQKVPNHIGSAANEMQVSKAQQIGKAVYKAILSILQKNETKDFDDSHFVVDCFINESGSKGKIFSIEPIKPLHCLSLFTQSQIGELYQLAKSNLKQNNSIKPQTKHVTCAEEYKEVDLSYYRVGWELSKGEALQEWKKFIQQK